MKKHFILLSTFAAWMLSATFLTSCGEEVQGLVNNGNNNETNTESTVGENCTLFSTSTEGTRTSMDTNREFYWSTGDQIYVNTDGTTYQMTSESRLAADKARADFVLSGVKLTAPKCSVVYIGNGTNSATAVASGLSVTIRNVQTQTAWGNADHIGPSGDCGVAEATKDDATGKYLFDLRHKASYLVFQPYKAEQITANWKLVKIEIIADGSYIAGTYEFGTGELVGTGSQSTVTLNCGNGAFANAFELASSASAANSCFAVVQPGAHKLKIRYTIKPENSANGWMNPSTLQINANDETFIIEKEIVLRDYNVNGVTTIRHKMDVMLFNDWNYYQWDAQERYVYDIPQFNPVAGPQVASDIEGSKAQYSCRNMPNNNEIYWYTENGDPHWDETSWWSVDYGKNVCTGGLWLKKKATILAEGKTFSEEYGIYPKTGEQRDLRLPPYYYYYKSNSQEILPASVRDKYFFLPALAWYESYSEIFTGNWRLYGYYWSSSPRDNSDLTGFSSDVMFSCGFLMWKTGSGLNISHGRRGGNVATESRWFQ